MNASSVEDPFDRLKAALAAEVDVLVAYLFGSTARGRSGPLSDVDVAVLLKDGDPHDMKLRLIDRLGGVVGSDRIDVVILNEAPIALAYRVLRDGKLLLSRDDKARIRHATDTIIRYIDMEPMRRAIEEGQPHRLEEGRFGRP